MFVHASLCREKSEIRLLRFIERANPAEPIQLELRHAAIDDVRYAALSYAWGDYKSEARITINGGSFTIGRNLHDGLNQLCQNGVRAWLWIDSICIHQSNLEEKTWQVAQMRAIYAQAESVYIWLGPGSHESDKAMDFACRVGSRALALGSLNLEFQWGCKQQNEIYEYIRTRPSYQAAEANSDIPGSEMAQFIFDLLHDQGLQGDALPGENVNAGIWNLMRRDYWHRIWIIQEISLAKEAIVLCGAKRVPLDIFDATFNAVSYCKLFDLAALRSELQGFGSDLQMNFYANIALTTRRQYRRQDPIRLADIVFQASYPPGCPFYAASDPRDILFGLLGIITDGKSLGLRVDYELSHVEVFTAMTRALIHDGDEHRGPYHLDKCFPREENPYQLPTWVPDWQEIGKCGVRVYRINHMQIFDATAGMPVPLRTINGESDDKLGLLRRPGCYVDMITGVMQSTQCQKNQRSASLAEEAKAWLSSIMKFSKLGPNQGPGENYVWRTIMAPGGDNGISHSGRHIPAHIEQETSFIVRKIMRRESIDTKLLTPHQKTFIRTSPFAHVLPGLETLEDQLACVARIWPEVITSRYRGRTLFKTEKGMFGLGHAAIHTGDIIALLWGVQSPIILRPRGTGGFTFVGDAYVDGIMNGEFLKTLPGHENFEIY